MLSSEIDNAIKAEIDSAKDWDERACKWSDSFLEFERVSKFEDGWDCGYELKPTAEAVQVAKHYLLWLYDMGYNAPEDVEATFHEAISWGWSTEKSPVWDKIDKKGQITRHWFKANEYMSITIDFPRENYERSE